jgi:hypothetical protein
VRSPIFTTVGGSSIVSVRRPAIQTVRLCCLWSLMCNGKLLVRGSFATGVGIQMIQKLIVPLFL